MTEETRRRVVTAGVLAAVVGLAAIGWTQRERFAPVDAGRTAPAYAAETLDGERLALEEFRGRVVLLNVWATWCPPCRWEMPALQRLHREFEDDGLVVLAVSVDAALGDVDALGREGGDVRAFMRERGLDFTVLRDPEGRVQRVFGVNGLPTTFLIDRSGRIEEKVLGPARWDEEPFSGRIRRLLEE